MTVNEMSTTTILLIVLIVLGAFALIPQWIALLIGVAIGTVIRINVPSIEGVKQWMSSIVS